MRAAIVEDDPQDAELLKRYFSEYAAQTGKSIDVIPYSDPLDCLPQYRANYELLVLDIQLISASTAGQADCPGFQTTPLTGSGILKTANPLYAAKWNTPAGS